MPKQGKLHPRNYHSCVFSATRGHSKRSEATSVARQRVAKSGIITQGISPPILLQLPRLHWVACAPEEFRLISRYTREEMGHVWSEEGKFRRWLEVELAGTE